MLRHAYKIILCILGAALLAGFSLNSVAQETTNEDSDGLRKSIRQLRTENEQLRARVQELEKRLEGQSVRDRLVLEEQRVENLQAQLVAVGEKEHKLQARLEEIEEQLRPENIDQLQILGSMRPEQVRETTRRRLTSEQNRLRAQLDLLQQSRTRLQSSLSVTELLVQSLRTKLQMVLRP
jgi:uncharacterized protein YlxW (UPF0749 family)